MIEAPVIHLGRPSLQPLPTAGSWLWTTREGYEQDLAEELLLAAKDSAPRWLVPSLIGSRTAPPAPPDTGAPQVTFARQAMRVLTALHHASQGDLAMGIAQALVPVLQGGPWTLHTWVPDSTECNPLSASATALHTAVERAVLSRSPAVAERQGSLEVVQRAGGKLAQVCLAAPGVAIVGAQPVVEAHSLAVGGRARMHVGAGAPSRAAMKLEEALDALGFAPEPGDLCADLGAAPGGWTWVLLERGARVIAVDPGKMAPDIARRRGLTHILGSAFDFEPNTPVDWLFCDMVWRPLEVAALLARWGRRRLARTLVANIKLPMRHKATFLTRIRQTVKGGGWQDVRTRHLYHDRDEVTLTAWRS